MGTKGTPKDELAAGTAVVCAEACGLVSVILVADGTNAATVKLYDHATAATGNVKKALAVKAASAPECAVYTPSKPDRFANGIVAVVAGTGAKAYVSYDIGS